MEIEEILYNLALGMKYIAWFGVIVNLLFYGGKTEYLLVSLILMIIAYITLYIAYRIKLNRERKNGKKR